MPMAAYFILQRKKTAWQMATLRLISSTGNPDLGCLNVNIICSCVDLFPLIVLTPSFINQILPRLAFQGFNYQDEANLDNVFNKE